MDDGDNSEDGGDSDSGNEEEDNMDILLDIIINPGLSVGQSFSQAISYERLSRYHPHHHRA